VFTAGSISEYSDPIHFSVGWEKRGDYWYQHDGVMPHTVNTTALLQEFFGVSIALF
jgi:hypothetical protein